MSDNTTESYDWPSPTNSKVIWRGGPESRFESASKLGGEPQEILYRLRHPRTECWHSDKDLPYFFENCPYCGVELKASAPQGVWLPPFGWAPLNGVSKSGRYHPRRLKNRASGWIIPGNGPLRFWILPLASSENGGKSYVFAYRPSTGQIYWQPDLQKNHDFSACTLEGERDAIRSLRGEPLGCARSWSAVWSNDHLFIGTKSGLLILNMLADGKIRVKKVFDGACLSSPAKASDGNVYFLAARADGVVGIATLDPGNVDSIQWCDWLENDTPSLEDLSEISAPVGVEYGDVHWVCRRGVIVLEGNQGRWISVKPGVQLETRVLPWFSGIEMRVYGREKEFAYVNYALSALKSGTTDGDSYKSVLPYYSGSDIQWFFNGQFARYQLPDLGGGMDMTDLWPVGAWEAEIGEAKWVAHILMARFDSHVSMARMLGRTEGYDKDVKAELTVSNNQTSPIHPHGNEFITLRMPLDTLTIPIGAESILIYKGDTDPSISVLDLGRSSFDNRAG